MFLVATNQKAAANSSKACKPAAKLVVFGLKYATISVQPKKNSPGVMCMEIWRKEENCVSCTFTIRGP